LLAITTVGAAFQKLTYNLKGDGALSFVAYNEVMKLKLEYETLFVPMAYPDIQQKATELAQTAAPMLSLLQGQLRQQWLLKAENICRSAFEYFNDKVLGVLGVQLSLYKVARYSNPTYVGGASSRPSSACLGSS
jgi:hypothetical protein